jgi:hypothetical protein
MNNNKLTILIPIHDLEIEREYVEKMFESVSKQENKDFSVMVATFEDLKNKISNYNIYDVKLDFLILPEEIKLISPNYTEIVNFAVHHINTDYFTVLQYDDIINDKFVNNVNIYSNAYPTVTAFLPINLEFDGDSFVRTTNESVWTMDYTEKQGYLDFETLKNTPIFTFNGATYKTEDFLVNNGFKNSIKKYFEYEFFLRLLTKSMEIMVIPKFMIRHTINRKNSLSEKYDALDKLELLFYQDLAKKEYFFEQDREITYKKTI